MTKLAAISNYFDHADKLVIQNKSYAKQVDTLLEFLLSCDDVEHDLTSKLFDIQRQVTATICANEDGIIAGIEEVHYFFSKTSLRLTAEIKDGVSVCKDEKILQLIAPAVDILKYERTILNILQRMSGIATNASRLQLLLGEKPRIAATRKTQWGLLDKKAVSVGGGLTHRLSLSDGILIKDNHLNLLSYNQEESLKEILQNIGHKNVEIEVESPSQAKLIKKIWQDMYADRPLILMLDNFTREDALKTIQDLHKSNIIVELSGGIDGSNISHYSQLGADVISLGSLTHSSHALDMSLQFE